MDIEPQLGDIDLSTVKARSVSGIVTLISRSFIQRLIGTIGFFLLSVFLGRPDIGLFIAVNDLVSILGYFSDIGLAASLVQKRDRVSINDLRTTFTLQQTLVIILILLAIIFSNPIISYYHVEGPGTLLYFSLLLAFFLSSLKTIPSVILERQLRFEVLALVEVIESVIFYTVAVIMASKGMGVTAYAVAVLLRGVVGTVVLYKLGSWPLGIAFSKDSFKSLLSFGLPYQLNSLMAVIKDRFVNIVLWRLVGADGIGIIGWAQNWSQLPLRFVMDNVTKVTFPAFSRLQDHPVELKIAIEKTLFFISLLSFPIFSTLAVFTPVVVKLIPRYEKWEVALFPLALFCFNSALASISTPLTNTFNALGKVKINTALMVMWTVLTWTITPFLAMRYGYMGIAYATAIIALSSIIPIVIAKKIIGFSLYKSFSKPLLASIPMIIIGIFLSKTLSINVLNLVIMVTSAGMVYVFVVIALVGQELFIDIQKLMKARRLNKK